MSSITIRPLDPREWEMFRDFRLAALRAAPGVFATSLAEAEARAPAQWQGTIAGSGPAHQVFGLFDGDRLIGITAAFTWDGDTSGATAMLAMSFILPKYRGRRLSHILYAARLDWIRAQPQFRRVIVSHRASNEASMRANRHFGFRPKGRAPRLWPDGVTEDEVSYELSVPR